MPNSLVNYAHPADAVIAGPGYAVACRSKIKDGIDPPPNFRRELDPYANIRSSRTSPGVTDLGWLIITRGYDGNVTAHTGEN